MTFDGGAVSLFVSLSADEDIVCLGRQNTTDGRTEGTRCIRSPTCACCTVANNSNVPRSIRSISFVYLSNILIWYESFHVNIACSTSDEY